MTTDASRLMRPEAGAPKDAAGYGHTTVLPSGRTVSSSARGSANNKLSSWPYEGLSRMKGNFHVRFLGGCGRVTARTYPIKCE